MRTSTLIVSAVAAALIVVPDPILAQTGEVKSQVYATFERNGAFHELIGLAVGDVPAGAKVTISCWGPSCPFNAKVLNMSGSAKILGITDMFVDTNFKPGTAIEVRITKAGFVGKAYRYEIESSAEPKVVRQCVPPDGTTPVTC